MVGLSAGAHVSIGAHDDNSEDAAPLSKVGGFVETAGVVVEESTFVHRLAGRIGTVGRELNYRLTFNIDVESIACRACIAKARAFQGVVAILVYHCQILCLLEFVIDGAIVVDEGRVVALRHRSILGIVVICLISEEPVWCVSHGRLGAIFPAAIPSGGNASQDAGEGS